VRAVLDVNVLVSALLSRGGVPARIIGSWLEGGFELVVSEQLLAELERALGYPKVAVYVPPDTAAAFVALLRSAAIVVADPGDTPARSLDPGDDYLLALAEAENALLVTGDQHLLDLADRFPIGSPRAFLESL
jgi:uncharacterized protein